MLKALLKVFITLCAVALAALLAWVYYTHYLRSPWTRDGQVQAYVVGVAARVSGPIVGVAVKNSEYVRAGDLLFIIDPTDYRQDLESAKATLKKAQTSANLLRLEVARRQPLLAKQFISVEDYQTYQAKYAEALAEIEVAETQVALAKLNLSYTHVYATVDGYVDNLTITKGTYVTKGQPLLALIDAEQVWITGFFRETDLKHIAPGKEAEVRFMGFENTPLRGIVESVGWGIFRKDGSDGQNLLPVVAPTVDWVRLAQRFPVRIRLIDPPADVRLRVGLTASVVILPDQSASDTSAPETVPNTDTASADSALPPSSASQQAGPQPAEAALPAAAPNAQTEMDAISQSVPSE